MLRSVHLADVNACVFSWPLGQDLDSHRGLHNRLWGHVRQDLEGARDLQKCENEEEGNHPFRFRASAVFTSHLSNKCLLSTYCVPVTELFAGNSRYTRSLPHPSASAPSATRGNETVSKGFPRHTGKGWSGTCGVGVAGVQAFKEGFM